MRKIDRVNGRNKCFSKLLSLFLAALLIGMGDGCQTAKDCSLTFKLWDNDRLRSFCEPASDPNLALFDAESRGDVLVEYDSLSDKRDGIQRRAYFLGMNRAKIAARKKPRFINPKLADRRNPIPVLGTEPVGTNAPTHFTAYATTSRGAFMFYWSGRQPEVCELPVYDDGSATFTRVALTPFAVAGDVVMVGVVAACIGAVMFISGMRNGDSYSGTL